MFWKIFIWVYLSISVFLFTLIEPTIFLVSDVIIWLITLVGLFGYAYEKRIFNNIFWRIWLFVKISWDVYFNFLDDLITQSKLPVYNDIPAYILFACILLTCYIGIYSYGYKNVEFWKKYNIE